MRVAIAGSSGLIGTALCRALRARGDTVIRLVRAEPPMPGSPFAIRWDPTTRTVDAGIEDVDAVVNLCGRSIGTRRWTATERQALHDSRIEPTRLLARTLAAIRAESGRGPAMLVNASAIGWYGDRGDEPITEASAPGAGFLADLCADWERATEPAEEAGVRVAHLRTGLVLSPSGGFLAKPLTLFKLGLGGRLGSGDQYWSWISLDDEVAAILHTLDHAEIAGPVNLTAPKPVTNSDFTAVLARLLHRPAALPVPRVAGRLLLGRELADEVVFGGQRVLPDVLANSGFVFTHEDVEGALEAVIGRE